MEPVFAKLALYDETNKREEKSLRKILDNK